jgi:hypothetical protein
MPPGVSLFMAQHVLPLPCLLFVSSIYLLLFSIDPHRPLSVSSLRNPEFFACFAGCSGRWRLRAEILPRLGSPLPGDPLVESSSVVGIHGEARLLLRCSGRLPPRHCSGRLRLRAGILLRLGSPLPRDPPGRAPPWPAAMVRLGSCSDVAAHAPSVLLWPTVAASRNFRPARALPCQEIPLAELLRGRWPW